MTRPLSGPRCTSCDQETAVLVGGRCAYCRLKALLPERVTDERPAPWVPFDESSAIPRLSMREIVYLGWALRAMDRYRALFALPDYTPRTPESTTP